MSAVVVAAALAAAGCGSGSHQADRTSPRFYSRPDLRPPVVTVDRAATGTAPGYVFLAPKKKVPQPGPLIVDDSGQPVWFLPLGKGKGSATDFRVQRYRGRPVLTWWQGASTKGIGRGRYEIYDDSYRKVAEVRAGNGLQGDEHEFLLTPQGTALITIYRRTPQDLSAVKASPLGSVFDSIVQEVDVATGKVVFEWHSLGNVPLTDSYLKPKKGRPFDYFHVNSVDLERNGDLLVSARHTRAVYEISRRTGEIVWQLGGKRSDFRMGPGTRFAWQHDARRQPDGTVTIFDNEAAPPVMKHSRVLVLRLDERGKTATLVRSYVHPDGVLAPHQGDAQFLPDGHVFVGWGGKPVITEFARDGKVLFDAHLPKTADSYRAFRFPWIGRPRDRPAVAVSSKMVYASWNGATQVASWRVLGGDRDGKMRRVAVARKHGFETAIRIGKRPPRVLVQALSADGEVLGTSRLVAPD